MRWRALTAFRSRDKHEADQLEQIQIHEVWQAHSDWVNAQSRLDYVIEPDEIDYVVYMWEAAEKRYEMLIRRAKAANMKKSCLVEG